MSGRGDGAGVRSVASWSALTTVRATVPAVPVGVGMTVSAEGLERVAAAIGLDRERARPDPWEVTQRVGPIAPGFDWVDPGPARLAPGSDGVGMDPQPLRGPRHRQRRIERLRSDRSCPRHSCPAPMEEM